MLKFYFFPGNYCGADYRQIVEDAYSMWNLVWSETFEELDGNPSLFSDDFTRQDEIGALFVNETCAGVIFLNYVNLDHSRFKKDSYFKIWSKEDINELTKDGNKVIIGSNITVHKDFRQKMVEGERVKNVVLRQAVNKLIQKDYDVMTGTMRCNRGMDTLAQSMGGQEISNNVIHHGVNVSLMGFYSKTSRESQSSTNLKLWTNRVEIKNKLNFESVNSPTKKVS